MAGVTLSIAVTLMVGMLESEVLMAIVPAVFPVGKGGWAVMTRAYSLPGLVSFNTASKRLLVLTTLDMVTGLSVLLTIRTVVDISLLPSAGMLMMAVAAYS